MSEAITIGVIIFLVGLIIAFWFFAFQFEAVVFICAICGAIGFTQWFDRNILARIFKP